MAKPKSILQDNFPQMSRYFGADCRTTFFGAPNRKESFAELLCGQNVSLKRSGFSFSPLLEFQSARRAKAGDFVVVEQDLAAKMSDKFHANSIQVPTLIELFRELPQTIEELHSSLRNSTTKEDLRRIRKAAYVHNIETAPQKIRRFHKQYVAPLLASRFPDDGQLEPFKQTLRIFKRRNGELICLNSEEQWLAGIINYRTDDEYSLGRLGILHGREDIRRMYVVAALIVRSLERGIELGYEKASLGKSIPFLGKGPIWFKAKWGGVLSVENKLPKVSLLIDLRHKSVRHVLARSPIVFCEDDKLSVACWLEPETSDVKKLMRDCKMFPGVDQWYVFGDRDTINHVKDTQALNDDISLTSVPKNAPYPLWLGTLIRG